MFLLVIKVIDYRQFGWKFVVGQCIIECLDCFCCDFYVGKEDIVLQFKVFFLFVLLCWDIVIEMEDIKLLLVFKLIEKEEEIVDWWSKFYVFLGEYEKCGQYIQKGYFKFKIYNCELENVVEFEGLIDFLDMFKLY